MCHSEKESCSQAGVCGEVAHAVSFSCSCMEAVQPEERDAFSIGEWWVWKPQTLSRRSRVGVPARAAVTLFEADAFDIWCLQIPRTSRRQLSSPSCAGGGCGTPPPLTGDRETLGWGDQARCEERIECFGGFYHWFAKMHNKFELNQNLKRCQCLKTGKLLHNTRKWDKNPLYTTVTSEARINNI